MLISSLSITFFLIGLLVLRKNNWNLSNELFSLYTYFMIVFIILLSIFLMFVDRYQIILVSIVLAALYSQYILYSFLKKQKLEKKIWSSFVGFYVFSIIYCILKSKNISQEIPIIVLFCLSIFSGKNYFQFFKFFMNFNQVIFYKKKSI